MQEKLEKGEAIDVSLFPKTDDGKYIMDDFKEDVDYCNAETESWIWSIGIEFSTGRILASHSADLYQNDKFECLWLR
jgi:hypothetical protein